MVFSKRSEFRSFFWCRIEVFFAKGPEVEESHKVQSVRAVVEQTIRDLKCFKIMDGNKIKMAANFEEVLDCVIALHNLRVLLNGDKAFDLPARRAAVSADHVFKPKSHNKMWISKFQLTRPICQSQNTGIFEISKIFLLQQLQL